MPIGSEIATAFGGQVSAQQALAASFAPVKRPEKTKRTLDVARTGADSALLRFGAELEIDAIKTDVVAGLDSAIRQTTGAIHGLGITDKFGAEIEHALGKPGQNGIDHALSDMAAAFACASDGDGDEKLGPAAQALTARFKSLCATISRLRGDADRQLAEAVIKTDAILRRIADLNAKIAVAGATTGASQDLIEARNGQFAELARHLDFQFYGRGDGALTLVTPAGSILVNDAKPKLAFVQTKDAITPSMSAANGQLGGVVANGRDISSEIGEGILFALLKLRDQTLPDLQSQIDTLAQTMQARLNQISNRSLGGNGARGAYRGSRAFLQASLTSIAIAGGEVVFAVTDAYDMTVGQIGLSSLVGRFLADEGQSPQKPWPIESIADALNGWTKALLKQDGEQPLVWLDEDGHFCVQLPAPLELRLFDRRSVELSSAPYPSSDQPLGLNGPLGFADTVGNLFQTPAPVFVKPSDSLDAIAAKLNQVEGLSARVENTASGQSLRVSSRQGTDILPEIDPTAARALSSLGFLPSPDSAFEDVAVSMFGEASGSVLTSRPFPSDGSPLGLSGEVVLSDGAGHQAVWTIEPDWTAATVVRAFSDQKSIEGLASGLMTMGNRIAIKLAVPMPSRITAVSDVLGLRSTAEQVVPGFANFLGLNDLFVADPADAFNAKAPTGVFATTATPGTAGALAFAGLFDGIDVESDTEMMRRVAEIFTMPVNIAAAGGLERSSESLCDYASRIVATAHAARGVVKSQLVYRKALLDGLVAQKSGLPAIDFDLEVRNLNGFRQALHDSSRIISTMGILFDSLAA